MDDNNKLLIRYLSEQGATWPEIERVISKLQEHDRKTFHDSVFDSIASGSFNLQEFIGEATNETS